LCPRCAELWGCDSCKIAGILDVRKPVFLGSADAVLKSRRTLATNRARLDHLAVSCSDKKRDHPTQGKIDSIDKLAGLEADHASLQGDLPHVLLKQFKSLARQGAQEPIALSRKLQHLG